MRRLRGQKPMPMDLDHMRKLHEEAIQQLELLSTALDAAEQSTDTMRDNLDRIAVNHWHAYMDVLHLICMHDDAINTIFTKYGMKMREQSPQTPERQFGVRRLLLLSLISALIRRHQRVIYVYNLSGEPTSDYLKESLTMEREHMSELIVMINSAL